MNRLEKGKYFPIDHICNQLRFLDGMETMYNEQLAVSLDHTDPKYAKISQILAKLEDLRHKVNMVFRCQIFVDYYKWNKTSVKGYFTLYKNIHNKNTLNGDWERFYSMVIEKNYNAMRIGFIHPEVLEDNDIRHPEVHKHIIKGCRLLMNKKNTFFMFTEESEEVGKHECAICWVDKSDFSNKSCPHIKVCHECVESGFNALCPYCNMKVKV